MTTDTRPRDEHGLIFTARHYRLAQTLPNHLTSEQLAELCEALEAAKARLDAREGIGLGNGTSPAFPKPKPPPPPPEAA